MRLKTWKPYLRGGVFCQRIIFRLSGDDDRRYRVLGIVLDEDDFYIYFKTYRREYQIRRELVESIVQTESVFLSGRGQDE